MFLPIGYLQIVRLRESSAATSGNKPGRVRLLAALNGTMRVRWKKKPAFTEEIVALAKQYVRHGYRRVIGLLHTAAASLGS